MILCRSRGRSSAGQATRSVRQQAMQSVETHLVKEAEKMVLLFTPAFDKTEHDPGYIKGYLPRSARKRQAVHARFAGCVSVTAFYIGSKRVGSAGTS